MSKDIDNMLKYLPKETRIIKTGDPIYRENEADISIEYEILKTRDIITAFVGLQEQAIQEVGRVEHGIKKQIAISKIRNMTHFNHN